MKLPASYYNTVSYIGTLIAALSLLLILFMFIISSVMTDTGSYLGLILFLALPSLLFLGLVMIPIGMYVKAKKSKKESSEVNQHFIVIDLNKKQHRNATSIFIVGTIIFLFLTGIGSYELYHYSESVKFCGTICHTVMKPEYVAYQNSAHASVACAQCHIGPGADWFVKSKITGLYQVYAVLTNNYPRPIPTPIENLRPARETCEQCHWPQKFYPNSLRTERHFLTDETNTEWEIQLRMKTGPTHKSQGQSEGIHWHINQNVQIEYAYTDNKRETIPYVRYINKTTGDTTVFIDQSNPIELTALDTLPTRVMDCMDCHNRPSHNYHTPTKFIDEAMAAGKIPTDLPQIKKVSMEILAKNYETTDSAKKAIENGVWNFYMENYPDLFKTNSEKVKMAVVAIQEEFNKNIFPEMKANWDGYPDHIGHREFNGCFRCHNDQHQSEDGKTISKDCKLCHSIILQGNADTLQVARYNESLDFMHPVDIGDEWKTSNCSDCHRYMY
ncbi:MAG: cytochrome C [Bacteroidetes bacterium GWA2_40_14]|nr:MAG: cytochrome C [Bacteroidetes bacterium GWA2_40_14]OFX62714.1 MAG: cytochrome C [Bacteroidetes bacterium GWC2_40_13]HAZ03338.1 cytochrome C [Marinilabiliales bacterium]HBO76007.1 cytochrome C [Marinilabiliales bacterium]